MVCATEMVPPAGWCEGTTSPSIPREKVRNVAGIRCLGALVLLDVTVIDVVLFNRKKQLTL